MMTSRAEYRLLLRQDNADYRLTELGHEIGLVSELRYKMFLEKMKKIEEEIERVRNTIIKPSIKVNKLLVKNNTTEISTGTKLSELIKRTELSYDILKEIDINRPVLSQIIQNEVNTVIKYEGYIALQKKQVSKFKELEDKVIPENFDYSNIKGIRLEAKEKLIKFKPDSIGQASRISGISPSDISVLLLYIDTYYKQKNVKK